MRLTALLDNDSPFGKLCTAAGNIILVNLLFVLTLVPVVTAGAGAAALYYTMLKYVRYGEIHPVKDFIKGFRDNFKEATLNFFLFLGICLLLFMDARILSIMPAEWALLKTAVLGLALILILFAAYCIPVLVSFNGTWKQHIKFTCFFISDHVIAAFVILAVNTIPMLLTYSYQQYFGRFAFLWCFFGFAFTAWICSHFFVRVFTPYLGAISQEDENERTETNTVRRGISC